ncbi:putative C6 transcription factor [Xylariaceae sp. FL0594]|nr:putative C6 transcription factor [Xylariaceae sp. FL0594]
MKGRQLVPIQPKPGHVGGDEDLVTAPAPAPSPAPVHVAVPTSHPSRARKVRSAILVACDPCRRIKSKCDGERPACRRCRNKGQECSYELPQDALSRSAARKEIADKLQSENQQLRQLYRDLATRPESEAYAIFQRLRSVEDPIALADAIRQAELLLPQPATQENEELTALQQLDSEALRRSPIRVSASAWTSVAGDGIVSELVSAWFKWDDPFLYAFIDRECFLRDLREADPKKAVYCSPFLVNAICAYRSYFSDTVDTVRRIANRDMREQFFAEANRLYDCTVSALPTIQGLRILFAVSSLKGEDNSGSMYRFASYGVLERSRMQETFASLSDMNQEDAMRKRAISKLVWGLFCLESMTSINFRHTKVLPPPKIPCLLPEFNYRQPSNLDLFGQRFTTSTSQPPFVNGAINAFCRVSVLMSEVREYTSGHEDHKGGSHDEAERIGKLAEYYARLNSLSDSLPWGLRHDRNFTPQTCYLRVAINTVAYAILQPLHPEALFDPKEGITVRAAIMRHCALDTELMERYLGMWGAGTSSADECYSSMAFLGALNSGTALMPLLPEESAWQLFPRICRLMHTLAARIPIARYVLRGWQAAFWSRKMEIPGPAKPYFQAQLPLGEQAKLIRNLPTSLVVVHVPNFEPDLEGKWDGGELGFLLKQWEELSLNERE